MDFKAMLQSCAASEDGSRVGSIIDTVRETRLPHLPFDLLCVLFTNCVK